MLLRQDQAGAASKLKRGTMFKFSMVMSPVLGDSKVPSDLNIANLNLDALIPSAAITIPLTGSTIVATAAVVTTCSASVDCTNSATPTCSGDVCVEMSFGGGSFTPDGTYDSLWDSV